MDHGSGGGADQSELADSAPVDRDHLEPVGGATAQGRQDDKGSQSRDCCSHGAHEWHEQEVQRDVHHRRGTDDSWQVTCPLVDVERHLDHLEQAPEQVAEQHDRDEDPCAVVLGVGQQPDDFRREQCQRQGHGHQDSGGVQRRVGDHLAPLLLVLQGEDERIPDEQKGAQSQGGHGRAKTVPHAV